MLLTKRPFVNNNPVCCSRTFHNPAVLALGGYKGFNIVYPGLLLLLALGACTPQVVQDMTAGGEARCNEAQALYDADRNAKAGWLTLAACVR